MRKCLSIIIFLPFIFGSCIKDQCAYSDVVTTASSSEIAYMQSYFTTNGITNVVQHSSGLFYTLNNPGTGATASLCNTIVVDYAATRFGYGNSFDSYTDPAGIPFVLGTLILGVKKLTPLVKEGGQITMYISPSMAYGNEAQRDQAGNVILPANSYIKFEMSLISVR